MAATATSATNGMEQLVRDARISMIYEGTNGVQALDLVGRKLPQGAGRMLRTFFHPVSEFIERNSDHKQLGGDDQGVRQSLRRAATGDGADRGEGDGGSRGSRRRRDRIPAAVRPGGAGLHVGRGRRSLRWRNWHVRMPTPRSTRPNSPRPGSSWSACCRRSAGCWSRSRPARAQ